MDKKLKIFMSILALSFALVPTLTEATTTPTEVERVKDYYYFKIHGGPWTPYPENGYGKAEFIYKNLSPTTQIVNVIVERTWGTIHDSVEFPRTLAPGEEWSSEVAEDFGVTVYFKLIIDGSPAFNSTIWVPPP